MKHLFKTAILFISLLLLVACGGKKEDSQPAVTFDIVMDAYQSGNFPEAAELCDALAQQGDTARMTWKQYCRIATVYALAYDHDYNTEASMASATHYIDRAYALQPDSVMSYAALLPVDESGAFNTALQTLNGLYVDDFEEYEEDDTDHTNHQH